MKTVLAVAAVLGLSASAAFADCAGHNKTTAAADVDTTITTASVTTEKQSRLPVDADTIRVEDRTDATTE
ncbi:hypothetical protein [Shinella oryzae]|uniref:hypothetical protein n=1 Tax=Shinella oryzae TaxID=2871820 RepID=UPI001FF2037C|nr:hypothetical protein [Shinella oryzae]UPA25855.1 hypothetical protein K6301_06605 [Shinella oryzae]